MFQHHFFSKTRFVLYKEGFFFLPHASFYAQTIDTTNESESETDAVLLFSEVVRIVRKLLDSNNKHVYQCFTNLV